MNVLIFAEQIDGHFKKSTFEAITYGNDIAKTTAGQTIAAVLGKVDNAHLSELANYGADKIIHVNNDKLNAFVPEAYAKVVAEIASKENASVMVISNTYTGKSIAGRVAAKLKAGIASGVISAPDTALGFKVRRGVFSGKAFADVNITSSIKVLAITPNTFDIKQDAKAANITEMTADVSDSDFVTNIIELNRVTGKIPLTEAEVVVSGGRGLKGPENWHLIEDLATALGAATACSKPVSDMHWRPHSEHVGQTGITIKPNLYIAVGISGAIQHLAGVSSSKVIVAINKDPEAPFFKAADYGIVGDAFEVMPKIIEAAKALHH
ncbi:MAG: electron transfer flavoprotein subunit alpha/FixB family protein [Bacteroidetes bacterium]|nr:electron transfer flavoprotein subunit alpha/FixB family protein [Bacteroidota bacterium]